MRAAFGLPLILLWLTSCSTVRPARAVSAGRKDAQALRSNILRQDYAGSAACQGCHGDIYQTFLSSPMHKMTRLPQSAEVRAPFSGQRVRFKDDVAELSRKGDERFMHIVSPRFGDHTYRLTKLIGGRYREDFAGVDIAATDRPGRDELILPLSYVFSTASFRLKGYSVLVRERPGLRAGGVWNRTCIFCHNTNPYFSSLFGVLLGPGAPAYQGEVVDALLPRDRRVSFVVSDPAGMSRALSQEVRFLDGTHRDDGDPRDLLSQALRTTRERMDAAHLVEIGIGCESCHGGSREHMKHFAITPSFEVRSPFLHAQADRPVSRAEWINRTCARCHQVLFSRYPFTWEGGRRRGPGEAGGSHITSGEARDLLLSPCGSALSCVACHDPHAQDSPAHLAELASKAGNRRCTGCHERYREDEALRAHAHHDPQGEGAVCINCHMPRKNMGLGYRLTRYHRIGSPTDPARVEQDRPLECAVCHGDKSTEALVADMQRLWGKHYDRGALQALYGDLSQPVLRATLSRGKPHEQATAIALLGERRDREALPEVAAALLHPYPLLRYYAREALGAITGAPCPVDLMQDDAGIRRQAEGWMEQALGPGAHRQIPWPELPARPEMPDREDHPSED